MIFDMVVMALCRRFEGLHLNALPKGEDSEQVVRVGRIAVSYFDEFYGDISFTILVQAKTFVVRDLVVKGWKEIA